MKGIVVSILIVLILAVYCAYVIIRKVKNVKYGKFCRLGECSCCEKKCAEKK